MTEIENFKQFYEDLSTGKNLLLDYNNNELECNKFGIKKPIFSRNITGHNSYQARLEKGCINQIKLGRPKQYFPVTNRLMGSPMCPRPLSIPFYNQEDAKEKSLFEEIKKEDMYKFGKNKKLFLKEKNKNELPDYFCTKLALDSPKNKKRLISLFENEIDNRKKKYRCEAKYYKKDSIFRGLNHQKDFFKKNLTKDMINGEKIPFTNQRDINMKFKVIKRLMVKNGLHKMYNERKEVNKEQYNQLYKIKRIKEITSQDFFNNSNYLSANINSSNNDKLSNDNKNRSKNLKIIQSLSAPRGNDIDYNRKSRQKITNNNLDSSISNSNDLKYPSMIQNNNLNRSIKFNSTLTTNYNCDNNITNNESKISKVLQKNELYTPNSLHKLRRTLSDFQPNLKNRLNIKEEETDLNNISDVKEKHKKIRNLKEMEKNYEHEAKLLKGYQIPINIETKEEPIKIRQINFISPAIIYKKEIQMFIKVNPIEYEKEMKRRLVDEKLLKKKKQNKKIFERIKLKK